MNIKNQVIYSNLSAEGSFFFENIGIRKRGHANRFKKLVPLGNIYLLWNATMIQAVRSVRGIANAKYWERVPLVEGVISPTFMPKIPAAKVAGKKIIVKYAICFIFENSVSNRLQDLIFYQ